MMMKSFVPEEAAEHWRATVDRLLVVGTEAGKAACADSEVLGDQDPKMQEFDDAIAGYQRETDQLLSTEWVGASSPQSLALLGGFQAVDALLRSSQAADPGGVWSDGGNLNLDAWDATLDDYVWAMTGRTARPLTRPDDIDATLDELVEVGAQELVALAENKAMWATLVGFGSGMVAFGGVVAAQAIEAVAGALNPFRRRVLDLLQWIVKRLRHLMPQDFRVLVDERLAWLRETVSGQDPVRIAEVLGQVFGRSRAREAWGDATSAGRDLTQEKRLLGEMVAGNIQRIGYIGAARKKMEAIAEILTRWVSLGVPQVQIVTGAAALTVFALVLHQVHDGFDGASELVAEQDT